MNELKNYLERPYQWEPATEDSRLLQLTTILCPNDQEIQKLENHLNPHTVGDQSGQYMELLAERVAWMMLKEESLAIAQEQIRFYLQQENWTQIELPSSEDNPLQWGMALTVYNFELQEWLGMQSEGEMIYLSFPLKPMATTSETRERVADWSLEEWIVAATTIFKEWD